MNKITRLLRWSSLLCIVLVTLVTMGHQVRGETKRVALIEKELQRERLLTLHQQLSLHHFPFPAGKDQVRALKSLQRAVVFAPPLDALDQLEQFPTHQVVATGYTAGVESTGKTPDHPQYGITYSGVPVQRGLLSTIAADPELFPLGTLLYIPDYGYGIVADTGSAIQGDKIDLYYETVDDVYREWGMRTVDVYVLRKGEGHLSLEMMEELTRILTAHSDG